MYSLPANVLLGPGGAVELACRLEFLSPKIDLKGEGISASKFEADFS
jgi:hypothetical protein